MITSNQAPTFATVSTHYDGSTFWEIRSAQGSTHKGAADSVYEALEALAHTLAVLKVDPRSVQYRYTSPAAHTTTPA